MHDPALMDRTGDLRELQLQGKTQVLTGRAATTGEAAVEQDAYEDEELPTEEELHTLRRIPGHITPKVYTIAYVEMVERLSYYGCTQVCCQRISATHRHGC